MVAGAQLAFWVVDEALAMEGELVGAVLRWVHTAWAIDRILVPFREANGRGMAMARERGWVEAVGADEGRLAGYRCFVSERSRGEPEQ